MAWTNSKIFTQAMLNPIAGRCNGTVPTSMSPTLGLIGDAVNVALFSTTTVPLQTDVVTNTGFNTGTWTAPGNEVTGGANWPTGGLPLASKVFSVETGTNSICFSAAYLTNASTVTIAGAFGCLIYDATISGGTVIKQGMCYNYFGGSQSVTAGTFCVDARTEILTARGWLRHDQVLPGDTCLTLDAGTGLEEWQPVKSVHVFTDGPYDVIRMEGPSHSSVTTPDHRWPAVTPGADGIGWYTTRTLPPDAQLCISASERTDKVADLAATPETADLVWCVQTPNQTWFARRDGTCYFTGNTIQWAAVGTIGSPNGVVFNISV